MCHLSLHRNKYRHASSSAQEEQPVFGWTSLGAGARGLGKPPSVLDGAHHEGMRAELVATAFLRDLPAQELFHVQPTEPPKGAPVQCGAFPLALQHSSQLSKWTPVSACLQSLKFMLLSYKILPKLSVRVDNFKICSWIFFSLSVTQTNQSRKNLEKAKMTFFLSAERSG